MSGVYLSGLELSINYLRMARCAELERTKFISILEAYLMDRVTFEELVEAAPNTYLPVIDKYYKGKCIEYYCTIKGEPKLYLGENVLMRHAWWIKPTLFPKPWLAVYLYCPGCLKAGIILKKELTEKDIFTLKILADK